MPTTTRVAAAGGSARGSPTAALDGASSGADDAQSAAEQAGTPQSLMSMIQGIHDTLSAIRQALDGAKGTTESEQQEASAWGTRNGRR